MEKEAIKQQIKKEIDHFFNCVYIHGHSPFAPKPKHGEPMIGFFLDGTPLTASGVKSAIEFTIKNVDKDGLLTSQEKDDFLGVWKDC